MEVVPFISSFLRDFIMNGCYVLSFFSPCIYWEGHTVSLFHSVNKMNFIDLFSNIKPAFGVLVMMYYHNHLVMMYHPFYILFDLI